jgi:hypothetical protein
VLVESFKHVTLVAAHNSNMDVDSAVFPVGEFNYADVTVNVHTLYGVGTPPSPHLYLSVWGSNTGQEWFQLTPFDEDITGTGLTEVSAFVTVAFIRFHLTLQILNSNAGDWATAILCCHANLVIR